MSDKDDIRALIRASNRAWTSGAPQDTAPFFHEKAVLVAPKMAARIEGRDAIVDSYVQYCDHARTLSFDELEASVDVFGDTAIAMYRFAVRFEPLPVGDIRDETAQEILVLRRGKKGWQIVWRTQTPAEPTRTAS